MKIKTASIFSNCVCQRWRTVPVDDALKEELFAYKVATIVLAVVTAIALICVIILIRYCIVRLRTASLYYLYVSKQLLFPVVYRHTIALPLALWAFCMLNIELMYFARFQPALWSERHICQISYLIYLQRLQHYFADSAEQTWHLPTPAKTLIIHSNMPCLAPMYVTVPPSDATWRRSCFGFDNTWHTERIRGAVRLCAI